MRWENKKNVDAKNLCKRTVLVQLIVKNVVTCFLERSVYLRSLIQERVLYQLTPRRYLYTVSHKNMPLDIFSYL